MGRIGGVSARHYPSKTAYLSWRWPLGRQILARAFFLLTHSVFSTGYFAPQPINTLSDALDSWNISGYHAVVAIIS